MSVEGEIAAILCNPNSQPHDVEAAQKVLSQLHSQSQQVVQALSQQYASQIAGSQAFAQSQYSEYSQVQPTEPVLVENPGRFVIFPIKYHDIWTAYKKEQHSFWTPNEVHPDQDTEDFKLLSQDE